jgi:hypothetical protein
MTHTDKHKNRENIPNETERRHDREDHSLHQECEEFVRDGWLIGTSPEAWIGMSRVGRFIHPQSRTIANKAPLVVHGVREILLRGLCKSELQLQTLDETAINHRRR